MHTLSIYIVYIYIYYCISSLHYTNIYIYFFLYTYARITPIYLKMQICQAYLKWIHSWEFALVL